MEYKIANNLEQVIEIIVILAAVLLIIASVLFVDVF